MSNAKFKVEVKFFRRPKRPPPAHAAAPAQAQILVGISPRISRIWGRGKAAESWRDRIIYQVVKNAGKGKELCPQITGPMHADGSNLCAARTWRFRVLPRKSLDFGFGGYRIRGK